MPELSPGLSSHGFRGSACIALFSGASSVVLSSGFVDSRRPATLEMSRVREAKMLIFRVLGRMSEMERVESLGRPLSALSPVEGS